jgi:HSP20 family protein
MCKQGETMMSTLNQIRHGLSQAWEALTEGWRELVERAGGALTRFHPEESAGDVATREERISARSLRWGVLAAEVKVNDDEVEVSIEVPGMDVEDFDINVTGDVLVERAYGAFERAVRLPVPIDETRTQASYTRGVLHITLPRDESHKARRIKVQRG